MSSMLKFDQTDDTPADGQMHLADVHGIFDE
jgi:hypothetical protein